MIKLSKFPFKTMKSKPKVSDNISTSLMLQAWLIRQNLAWVYTYTTLWLRVLRKISNIVREEMDKAWAYEMLMSSLSSRENWEATWRWDNVDVFFHVPSANNKEYGLNFTHEEIVTPLMKEFINSYKDLPVCVYQIQTKFRNEKRAKSWLLRWREFLMKDAYSFHLDPKEFDEYYENMKKVYMTIFDRLWIWKDTYITLADGGSFTDKYSHEFQTLLDIWEDDIYICKKCWTSHNKEIVPESGFKCVNCGSSEYEVKKAAEVWNIFPLETKFTDAFDMTVLDKDGKQKKVIMWCYGIWVSRIMWVIAEKFATENGINWPENIAPADVYIIVIWEENIQKWEELAKKFEQEWKEVILDDRMWKNISFWVKAKDCELLWIKTKVVISPKTLEKWWYEITKDGKTTIIKF